MTMNVDDENDDDRDVDQHILHPYPALSAQNIIMQRILILMIDDGFEVRQSDCYDDQTIGLGSWEVVNKVPMMPYSDAVN